jgi:hypothetical protein
MSFTLKQDQNPFSKFSSLARIIGILLIALGVFLLHLNKLLEQWVLNLYGNVEPDVRSRTTYHKPSLEVTDFDIQTQNYTMSAQTEGNQQGDDASIVE